MKDKTDGSVMRDPPSLNPSEMTTNYVIAVAKFVCCKYVGMIPVAVVLGCGLCLFVHSSNKLCNEERGKVEKNRSPVPLLK